MQMKANMHSVVFMPQGKNPSLLTLPMPCSLFSPLSFSQDGRGALGPAGMGQGWRPRAAAQTHRASPVLSEGLHCSPASPATLACPQSSGTTWQRCSRDRDQEAAQRHPGQHNCSCLSPWSGVTSGEHREQGEGGVVLGHESSSPSHSTSLSWDTPH